MQSHVNDWEHALITGNGRQGALCWGAPSALRFTLAHEDLFQPVTEPLPAPDTAAALPRIRDLIATSRFSEAARAVCDVASQEHEGYAKTRWIDPLIGAATLVVTPSRTGGDHERGTDFDTGVVSQKWGAVTCDAFFSRPADALIIAISDSAATVDIGPIEGTPERPIDFETHREENGLVLTGRFDADWEGALDGYTVAVRFRRTPEGVLIVARTAPGLRSPAEALASLPSGNYAALLEPHAAAHRDLFRRVSLDLGGLREQTLFGAGRYAIISSSGNRPPTLQGVWSGTYSPPWRSGWTIDGNLQAALLAVHSTGTPELMVPLFDLLSALLSDFRENARRLYGMPGLLAPAHLGTHGRQNHFGPIWCLTFWTAGAAWLARLYVDHWQYTGDRAFLTSRALPFLREVAEFHLAFAEIVDGRARFSPSYSPENDPGGLGAQACADATLDVQAVRFVLESLLLLDSDDARAPRWRDLLDALPPYRVTESGELAEWLDPRFADHHAHRHCSHFFPFLYGGDPVAPHAAAVKAIRSRLTWWLSAESDEMGYGLALVGVAAAHLGLAEEAHSALRRIMDAYWRPNLVPTHNRDHMFNVDLAGGFPALMVAMLLRSRDLTADGVARFDLLPALPAAWPRGTVRGLVARGPVVVDLTWSPSGFEATLTSPVDRTAEVGHPGGRTTVALVAGRPARISP
ncbi:glycoside hydrolase N-terminal domain-containing protein [Actinoplanes sp. NPDC051861]|uniref:glycosyl hydrolase family 95 catalytic domain-containing protein n=1 Tax=Actinoplanes sp. NPDC051861 TaxID=3155170 RepID=UPI0034338ADE